jgi:predicted RNA-binding protein with PIN domain
MSLQFIIDGYNLIHHPLFRQTPKFTDSPASALLQFITINKLTGSPRNKITVVFDGYPPKSKSMHNDPQINLIFTAKDTADERIKKILESASNPKNIVVVSDDKEIRFFVKSSGGRVMGVDEFICLSPSPKTAQKAELTYSQMEKINQELRKIWLK